MYIYIYNCLIFSFKGPSFEAQISPFLEAEAAAEQLCAWDANTRRFGLQSLALLGPAAAEHVPAMAKLLEDEEPEVGITGDDWGWPGWRWASPRALWHGY